MLTSPSNLYPSIRQVFLNIGICAVIILLQINSKLPSMPFFSCEVCGHVQLSVTMLVDIFSCFIHVFYAVCGQLHWLNCLKLYSKHFVPPFSHFHSNLRMNFLFSKINIISEKRKEIQQVVGIKMAMQSFRHLQSFRDVQSSRHLQSFRDLPPFLFIFLGSAPMINFEDLLAVLTFIIYLWIIEFLRSVRMLILTKIIST